MRDWWRKNEPEPARFPGIATVENPVSAFLHLYFDNHFFASPLMKTILCPTDFSENSRHGLQYAIGFAKLINAQLLLLHVVPIPYLDRDMFIAEPMAADLDEARRKLTEICRETAAHVPCETLAQSGAAADMIVKIAKDRHVDWIVIGTKGADNVPEALVGSVAAEVAQKTACPLLIIPQGVGYKAVTKMVLAADFHGTEPQLLTPLMEIAKLTGAEVLALHVEPETAELTETKAIEAIRLENWLGDVNASVHITVHSDVQEGIDVFVREENADMVAVIARQHGFFESLFHRSVTRMVALYTTVPTLVIREQAD